MALITLIPELGLIKDPEDLINYVIPELGVFNASPLPVPYLSSSTDSNIGTTTATIGVTTSLVVDANDILYYYVSTSATPPSAGDLIAGTGAAAYGNDATPTTGANTFNVTGLTSVTTYYSHFYQTSDNGNSVILSSSSWATLDPSDLFAAAATLVSLASTTTTSITATVTTPNDNDHGTVLFYYREVGQYTITAGGQGLTVKDTTDTFDILGLTSGTSYEVFVIARDTVFKQSVPSIILARTVLVSGGAISEEELFLNNLKTILSKSETFQTWCGAANEAAALSYIFKRWKDEPSGKYAMLKLNGSESEALDETTHLASASLGLLLVDDTVLPYETRDSEDSLSDFSVVTGKIIADLEALESVSSNLAIRTITMDEEHSFAERTFDDDDLVMTVNYNIETRF